MSRPLVCDNCNEVLTSPITPIKLVMNGALPEEYNTLSHQEVAAMQELAKLAGGQIVPQTFLDFCSTVCLAVWAWKESTGLEAGLQVEVPAEECRTE